MKNQDWEHEAQRDIVFALERAAIEEQEYYACRLPALVVARIPNKTKKKDDNRNNTKPVSTTSKESI